VSSAEGKLIVLEGGDGCGKSTQVALLAETLRRTGRTVVETREPGGTNLGRAIRTLVLEGGAVDPAAEMLLMAADRAQHVAEVIGPAMARGAWVVSDRFLPSSLVYQGIVRGLGVEVVERVNLAACAGIRPDLVIVLDVDDEVADARRSAVDDRLEREGDRFHEQVRAAYRELARDRGWQIIDANADRDEVAARIAALVARELAR
jgi:dTMP kinase